MTTSTRGYAVGNGPAGSDLKNVVISDAYRVLACAEPRVTADADSTRNTARSVMVVAHPDAGRTTSAIGPRNRASRHVPESASTVPHVGQKLSDSLRGPLWYPPSLGRAVLEKAWRKRASMRSLLGPRILGVVLFLAGQTAAAQARPYPECLAEPTEGDIAAAKGAFQAGQASFNEADYERAITYWEDAYRRDCTAHALLLNLARAYELKGDKAQAVEALQTFLARKPESPQKDQIERRIVVLNQQIATEAPEVTPAAAAPEPPQETATELADPTPHAAEPSAPASPAEPRNHWIGPAIVGGAGLAAAVTGVVLHSSGSSDEEKAAEACPTRQQCSQRVEDQGNRGILKQKIGVGLIIGGGAAVAGGVAWYFLTKPQSSAASPTEGHASRRSASGSRWLVVPEAGEGYAGVTAVGTF